MTFTWRWSNIVDGFYNALYSITSPTISASVFGVSVSNFVVYVIVMILLIGFWVKLIEWLLIGRFVQNKSAETMVVVHQIQSQQKTN